MSGSTCRVGVVVDFSFDEYMHQRDLGKACKQLLRCYSLNRRLSQPMQFSITGLKDGGRGRTELSKHEGFTNWDVHLHQQNYHEVFDKKNIVYLSSESDNVISDLEGELQLYLQDVATLFQMWTFQERSNTSLEA